ncbi:MAG: phosphoglucomutase/phosphomannomutase family protein, partial [Crocinitomicaceae bacterium]
MKIKFGTDGWRAIIAKEFTVENVARVSEATGIWLKKNYQNPSVFVGHDCRFAGELFMETAVKVFVAQGIPVKMSRGFVSTPMISLAAHHFGCQIGVDLTASHNPPSYNGFKLKADFGGPLAPEHVQEVEDIIPIVCSIDYEGVSIDEAIRAGKVELHDIETMYVEHVKKSFDIDAIEKSGMRLVYDAMYGAGQRV